MTSAVRFIGKDTFYLVNENKDVLEIIVWKTGNLGSEGCKEIYKRTEETNFQFITSLIQN